VKRLHALVVHWLHKKLVNAELFGAFRCSASGLPVIVISSKHNAQQRI
jgi:hypothetical protein